MRRTLLLASLMLFALLTVPASSQPPPTPTARQAIPGVIQLEIPKSFELKLPPAPTLTPPQDRRRQLWMVDLATQNNTEAMALIHKVDVLLYHPLNEGYRPTMPEALLALVHGANRALQYEQEGYRAPPASKQIDDMLGNSVSGLTARLPLSGQQALVELMKKLPVGKWLQYVPIADQALGEKLAEAQYQFDKAALRYLDEAARRATPGSLHEVLHPTAASSLVWDAAGRLLGGAAKGDKLAAALVADNSKEGLGVYPDHLANQGRDAKRYENVQLLVEAFEKTSKQPISANNPYHPPSQARGKHTSELTAGEKRALGQFARELRLHRQALDRNTAALKELSAKIPTTPQQTTDLKQQKQKLLKDRLEAVKEFGQGAEAALQCLANLGVDPGLVRDLTTITHAGVQVYAGVAMAIADISSPIGWFNILGGITSLFNSRPDPLQIILEQLAAIRRELADFRYEMRLTLAEIRVELRIGFEKVLTRLNDLEYHLTSQLREIKEQSEWNEYRLNRIEGQISALGQQILTRFAELQQRDLITLLAARDLNPKAFTALSTDPGASELLKSRYHDALAVAYASAVHHAANWSLAKGDTDVPGAYGTITPSLGEGSPRLLLSVVQDPAAPWANINDFVRLARTVDPNLLPPPPVPEGKVALKLAPDRTRLVNPLAWNVAAGAFLDLAVDGGDYFRGQKELVRGMVEVYRRGEEFNDATHRIGTADKGGVFAQLINTQLRAIDELERQLKANAGTVITNMGGLNPWADIKQDLPDGKYVHWDGPTVDWVKWLHDTKFHTSGLGDAKLDFPQAELEALIPRGVVPKPFAAASLIRPAEGRGGDQSVFGGSIRLSITTIDVPLDGAEVKHRWSRRESTGFLGTGPGRYHDRLLYEGPVYVTIEGHYRTSRASGDYLIFRHRLPTPTIVRFEKESHPPDEGSHDPPPPTYWHFPDKQSFDTYLGFVQGRRPFFRGGSIEPDYLATHRARKDDFEPLATVAADWPALRQALAAQKPTDWLNPQPGATPAAAVERAVTQRIDFEVKNERQKNAKAVFQGLTTIGDQIREIVGCQGLILRYVQLAIPEAQGDQELLALLLGDQAAWGGTAIIGQFQLAQKEGKTPFVREVKDPKGKVTGHEIPVVGMMRAQTLKLQAKLAELVGRKRADPAPARHPAVEGMLLRIVFTARSLGIDLESELKVAGVTVPEHWICHQLNNYDPFIRRETSK